jgi:stearoyl-CoA desaturase (delta-9 desaturase)
LLESFIFWTRPKLKRSSTEIRRIDWVNVLFLSVTALITFTVQPLYIYTFGLSWPVFGVFVFYLATTGLAITGGYHRLFAHRSYQANNAVKLFYLLFGAAACQNSALKWASNHRDHHAYTEQEKDPYNINKGFFYAHMGWVFYKETQPRSFDNVKDLSKDPLILWQHRHYVSMAIFVGGGIPFLAGYLLGDLWGCFLLAGVTRTVLVHHATFLINSICHMVGNRPYSLRDTARDNGFVAFLTYGEGYHNYHHQFPYDYRNGIRWYQWDPTKWLIKTLETVGWAGQLRRAPEELIFKARIRVEKQLVQRRLTRHRLPLRQAMEERVHASYEALIKASTYWEKLKTEYRMAKDSMDHKRHEIAARLERELQMARARFHAAHEAWSLLVQGCLQSPA